jgi:hypothetical protein
MALAVGPITQISVADVSDSLSCAAATGGTGPYTYQWYRSETTGFTPGGGNIISGATALALSDSGLIPNTTYYYKVVVTDTGNSNATANSSQSAVVTTAQQLSPNQFAERSIAGMCDLRYNINTVSALISPNQSGVLVAGQAVKIDSAITDGSGIPQVIGCVADTDEVFGFINFDIKTPGFYALNNVELSLAGNAMYLWATGVIARGDQVTLDVSSPAGVAEATGDSANRIVGWAYDGASSAGVLIRIMLGVPSFALDG